MAEVVNFMLCTFYQKKNECHLLTFGMALECFSGTHGSHNFYCSVCCSVKIFDSNAYFKNKFE